MTKHGWLEYDITCVWPNGEWQRERRQCPRQSQSAAHEWAKARERELYALGAPSTREAKKAAPLFEAFAERCLVDYDEAERNKRSTIKTKRVRLKAHLLPLFRGRHMDSFTDEDLTALKKRCRDLGRSVKTTNNLLSDLAVIFYCAAKWKVVPKDSLPVVEMLEVPKKRMPYHSVEHYEKQLAGARLLRDPRPRAAIALAGDGGMRRGEILALDWPRVDLELRELTVEVSEVDNHVDTTKGDNFRIIPMTDEMHAALSALPHRKGRVIYGRGEDGGVDPKTLADFVRRAEARAGVAVTGRLHVLRHSAATHQAQGNQSLYKTKAFLGHADIKTTEGYATLNAASLRVLTDSIDARRRGAAPVVLGEGAETIPGLRSQRRKQRRKVVEAVGIEPSAAPLSQPPETTKKT